jgi:hypothetical protein
MRSLVAVLLLSFPVCAQTSAWTSLFEGQALGKWRATPFRGAGKVSAADGVITLGAGEPMTGVTWSGEFPRAGYEIRFEARRTLGGDFFASLTFPVGESFATFVSGGWGGDIIGISSLDGWDASDNETRNYFTFENGRWYPMRVRVTTERITVWIEEKQVVDVQIAGRSVGLRPGDIKLSAPLGFASYNTAGELRKIEYRTLGPR